MMHSKRTFSPTLIASVFATAAVSAAVSAAEPSPFSGSEDTYAGSYSAELSYTAASGISQGTVRLGDLTTLQNRVGYLGTFKRTENYSLLAGFDWQRFSFGLPDGTVLPNTLQSTAVKIGNNWRFAENWSMRLEAEPGIYSDFDDLSGEDFNVPFLYRLTYDMNPNLSWTLGLSVNFWSDVPVIGGVGVRWRFADQWTLNLILPRPRIEYRPNDSLTLFAGGELKGGSYRVAEDFGRRNGNASLDGEILDYREIRAGAGLRWNFSRMLSAGVDGGWTLDRRFHFDDRDLQINGKGAPYVQFVLSGKY